jgi:hypothetical protein
MLKPDTRSGVVVPVKGKARHAAKARQAPRGGPPSDQADGATGAQDEKAGSDEPVGATEEQIGDRTGPAAGYDQEPEQDEDEGGVA